MKPGGGYGMNSLDKIGGIPLVMKKLLDNNLIHGYTLTVTGKTIEEILYEKSKVAFNEFKKNNKNKKNTFVIAGGVASNKSIRQKLTDLSLKEKFDPIFPPINLCSDNAAMIAMVGLEKYKLGLSNSIDFPARPRWPLDENAVFLKGAGVKL